MIGFKIIDINGDNGININLFEDLLQPKTLHIYSND